MTEYALVRPDDTVDRVQPDSQINPTVATRAGWRWLPVVIVRPPIDPATELLEGPTYAVGTTEVQRIYTSRPKTAQELDGEKEAQLPAVADVLLRALFNHENRIRDLEQRPQITAEQFRTALKALL
jgi:hypothetical protein